MEGREGARKKEKREEQGREESGQEEWKDEGRERNQSAERIFNTSILLQVLGTYVRMYVCMYSSMNIRTYVHMKVRTCLEANKCMMY